MKMTESRHGLPFQVLQHQVSNDEGQGRSHGCTIILFVNDVIKIKKCGI